MQLGNPHGVLTVSGARSADPADRRVKAERVIIDGKLHDLYPALPLAVDQEVTISGARSAPAARLKLAAGLSLVLWLAVILCGRFIAYLA